MDSENVNPRILKTEIINILQHLVKNTDTSEQKKNIEDDRLDEASKRSNYITENYQKFKQSENQKQANNTTVTPVKDKRFNDNINYISKPVTKTQISNSSNKNVATNMKDNNFLNKFINK
jgi:hypothetical protein